MVRQSEIDDQALEGIPHLAAAPVPYLSSIIGDNGHASGFK